MAVTEDQPGLNELGRRKIKPTPRWIAYQLGKLSISTDATGPFSSSKKRINLAIWSTGTFSPRYRTPNHLPITLSSLFGGLITFHAPWIVAIALFDYCTINFMTWYDKLIVRCLDSDSISNCGGVKTIKLVYLKNKGMYISGTRGKK